MQTTKLLKDKTGIHVVGKFQSFGCCFAFNDDWILTHVSANVSDFIGYDPQTILGKHINTIFSRHCVHDLRSRLHLSLSSGVSERIFKLAIQGESEPKWDVSIHKNAAIIIELERASPRTAEQAFFSVRNMISQLPKAGNIAALLGVAANKIRAVTNFDRVVAYRFFADESESGEILAESKSPQVDTFIGQQFSAFDIPHQTTALLKQQTLRVIADVNDPGIPVYTHTEPPQPLDLTFSMCKSGSHYDVDDLISMKVQASLTISILIEGKLWGMFTCHNRKPKYIPLDTRTLLEFFIEVFSLHLDNRLLREQYE